MFNRDHYRNLTKNNPKAAEEYLASVNGTTTDEATDTTVLVAKYEELSWKNVSIRYKNDVKRLEKKIAELSA